MKDLTLCISKMVIPCHYNCPAFFTKTYNPADTMKFKQEVKVSSFNCVVTATGKQ